MTEKAKGVAAFMRESFASGGAELRQNFDLSRQGGGRVLMRSGLVAGGAFLTYKLARDAIVGKHVDPRTEEQTPLSWQQRTSKALFATLSALGTVGAATYKGFNR